MTAATTLARSRTAWAALTSALVAIIGPRVGLTADEVGVLVAALQGVIATLYVSDTRAAKRGQQ